MRVADPAVFGSSGQQTMLDFRVHDLEAMLAQLRAKGADVVPEAEDVDGLLNGHRQF
jgi:predicted enzyme related to lactoylglutathione lyase